MALFYSQCILNLLYICPSHKVPCFVLLYSQAPIHQGSRKHNLDVIKKVPIYNRSGRESFGTRKLFSEKRRVVNYYKSHQINKVYMYVFLLNNNFIQAKISSAKMGEMSV